MTARRGLHGRPKRIIGPETGLSDEQRRVLDTELSHHLMFPATGHCGCGLDLSGSDGAAEQHYFEVAMALGVRMTEERG